MTNRRWRLWLVVFFASAVEIFGVEPADVAIRCVIDPRTDSVLQSRTLHVYVHGLKPDVTLTNPRLSLNEVLRRARPDLPTVLRPDGYTDTSKEVHLGDGSKEFELIFTYLADSFWSPMGNFNLVQLEPGTQVVTFEADTQVPAQDSGQAIPPIAIDFPITAPMLSIMLGGGAGAFALAALRFVYRLRSEKASVGWRTEVGEAVIAIGVGALIAWMLTFVGGLVSSQQLGVQISATSWKGGVIIGLFSYKLGDVLAQKLWNHPAAPQTVKEKKD